jgi:hypothetical protein
MTPTAVRRSSSEISTMSYIAPERRPIPFDYAFRYQLEGTPGKVLNSVVSVSIEALFTAVSISYGVVPKVQPIVFGPAPVRDSSGGLKTSRLVDITLEQVLDGLENSLTATGTSLKGETGPEAVLKNGVKLNAGVAEFALQGGVLSVDTLNKLFQVVGSPSELIQFKYAIFDEGSGREFQSEPILNIAGLGSAAGERPFRHFAQPITFGPRSTIRMEITEVSDFRGELHVALQGYKVLGNPGSPTGTAHRTGITRRR